MIKFAAAFVVRIVSSFFRLLGWRACRFHPSCSEYAAQAFDRFSAPRALSLSAGRVLRCHPLSQGGFDPVPERN